MTRRRAQPLECTHAAAVWEHAQAAAAIVDGVEVLSATPSGVRLRVASLQVLTRYWRAYADQGPRTRENGAPAADPRE